MTTTIEYFDVCGHLLGRPTSQIGVEVTVGSPLGPTAESPLLPPAVGSETNPIHLAVGEPTVAGQLEPGSISLASAKRINGTSPNVNLQYWNLALSGTALTGTLVQDHREEAAAYNLLAAHQQLVPCQDQFGYYPDQFAIAEGTQLSGTLTSTSVQLRILGNVVEGTRPFLAEIAANRVR